MTAGNIDLGGNNLTLGTSTSALGILTYTSGLIRVTSGTFTRWFGTSGLPTTTGGTGIGFYPLAFGANNRAVNVYFSTATALTTGGTITIGHTDAGGTTAVAVTDGAYNIEKRTNTGWTVSQNGLVASGTISLRLSGGGISALSSVSTSSTNLRLMQASAITGTHVSSSYSVPNYRVDRTGFTIATLATTHYIGASDNDMPTIYNSITSGDWNSNSTWDLNSPPTCSAQVNINSTHNVTVNSASNQSKNVTINTGGTLTVASGDLTVGCTLNNNTLTNNGTLTVNGGTLNVNGNVINATGSTFNQSGGDIIVDANGATSVASGTIIWAQNSGLGTVNGGTLTIVDPPATGTARSFAYNVATTSSSWAGHTLKFGDGISTAASANANGFEFDTYISTGELLLGNVIVDGGNLTNRWVSTSSSLNASNVGGNLTINLNSEIRTISSGTGLLVGGNITNNGTLTTSTFLALGSLNGTTFIPSTVHQTISGSGTFRNSISSSTASFVNFQVFNSNATGVTLSIPLSVSGTLFLDQGIVNTTSTNILRLGTATAAGTLSGGSATAYINGPFARTFPSSRTASGTYTVATLFPVGKAASAAYLPIHIDPTTTSGGSVIFSGEAFTSNAGSGASGVTGLSNNRWEALITSGAGNFTSSNIRLNDAAIVTSNKILQAPTAAGTYGSIVPVSTFAAGTPNTLTTTGTQILAAAYTGYFAYGNLEDCIAPANQPTGFTVSTLGTTSFTGSFTAASSNPSHYLVVRYPSGGSVTNPSNFTTYSAGNVLGSGTIQAVLTSPTVSFNASLLTANTSYDYYVYSYNNVACNGPVYNTTNPLMGMVTTCATTTSTPGTPTASSVTSTSFTATWTASSTPGVTYIIDVATNAGFTTFLSGYQGLNVGMALTTNITGLTTNTAYFVRVSAVIGSCFSLPSGSLTVITNCNAVAPPRMEGFEDNTNNLDCWRVALVSGSTNWAIRTGSSGDIAGAFAGSTFLEKDYNTSNAVIYSLPLDYTSVTNPTRLNVYLHRHTSAHINDEYRIHVNTSPSLTGATQILSLFSRTTTAPTVPSTGWYNYLIDIPVSFHGAPVVYIIFQGITTAGFSSYDLGVDEFKVEPIPSPTITSLSTTSGCPGSNLEINGTNLLGATPANVQIGGTPVASITSNTGTVLNVVVGSGTTGTVSVTIGANTATSTDTYTVNPKPSASASSNTPVCVGSTINLDGTTNAGMGATFNWSGPNSFTSTSEDPMITGVTSAAAGTYTFTATSAVGCTSDPATTVVIVNSLPSVPTAGSNSPVCLGSSLNLTAANIFAPYSTTNNSGVSFIDINATGTSVGTLSDDSEHNLTIPSFTFNNVAYTTARVGTNGVIALGSTTGEIGSTNASLPSTSNTAGNVLIAPFWDDLDIQLTGTIKTETVGSKYIVQYTNINHDAFTTGGITFQVQFDLTTSQIHLVYQDVIFGSATYDAGISATVGIQYSSTQATQFSFNSASLTNGQSITFTPTVPTYSWSGPNSFTSSIQNPTITGITTAGAGVYTVTVTNPSTTCSNTSTTNVTIATTAAVTSSNDSGAGSLRAAIACIAENGIITYDQPTTTTTILTTPLTIDKNVTIQGLSGVARPEITTDPAAASGIIINVDKTLTLQNVDFKSTNPAQTFSGAGNVSITGLTISKP
jgi:hypothetical protein